jgi:hypothetical protein
MIYSDLADCKDAYRDQIGGAKSSLTGSINYVSPNNRMQRSAS